MDSSVCVRVIGVHSTSQITIMCECVCVCVCVCAHACLWFVLYIRQGCI